MHHVTGATGAAPIWRDVMETLLKGRPAREFVEPEGMVWVEVCADNGLQPAAGGRGQDAGMQLVRCPRTINEIFIEGTEPTRSDDWHRLYTLDLRNGLLADPDCPPEFATQERYTLYPAEAQDWVRSQNIPQPPETYSPLCPNTQTVDARSQTDNAPPYSLLLTAYSLLLTSPDQGSRYRLSSEIPESAQRVLVAARPVDGVVLREVTLLVDDQPLATLTRPPYQALWQMEAGTHVFTAMGTDAKGDEIVGNYVIIEVID
jgi:membrane carboxypeptidase/penicillin-binding protein PbpC